MTARRLSLLACCAVLGWVGLGKAEACELCAIYSSANERGGFGSGFLLGLSESYVAYRTVQFEGEEVDIAGADYVDTSITHLVGTYNFTERLGLSLNVPFTYHHFHRSEVRFSDTGALLQVDQGSEFGLGDLALVGRATLYQKKTMRFSVALNLLGGVKFPTGDASRIKSEVNQARVFESFLPPGYPHDPLGHTVSGVHEHDLALGSGSFDGIIGATLHTRWQRWFANAQFQYYARTEGESTFQFGNELMLSGGPGRYLVVKDQFTLSLEANAAYETSARDRLLGRTSDYTGMTAWYLGPLVNLTWKDKLSANAGVDIPLRVTNGGLQNVPTYRIHGGVSWRF